MNYEDKKHKTDKLLEQLSEGVQAVYESDAWLHFLSYIQKFRHYSWANTLLIAMQAPETQYVASMTDWRNKFGRRIRKGSKAIRIIAPHTIRKEDTDGDTIILTGFHAVSVFPVEATEPIDEGCGDIPEICHTLDTPVGNYQRLLDVLIDISPVPVSFGDAQGAYGYFSPTALEIRIQEGLPESQTIKTLIHEIGHSLLHCIDGEYEKVDKATKELQAESIAFTVSQFCGLDTSEYSFPYCASYAQGKDVKALKACIATIQKTAVQMMDAIEERLAQDGTDEGASNNAA